MDRCRGLNFTGVGGFNLSLLDERHLSIVDAFSVVNEGLVGAMGVVCEFTLRRVYENPSARLANYVD